MVRAPVLAALVVYGILLLLIGMWGSRQSKDVAGYYVAGKTLPSWVIAFSTNATGESAWLLLGLTGMGYAVGVHALWIVLGEVVGVAIGWAAIAPRFKDATDRTDAITVPDWLEARFPGGRHGFRWLGLAVILTMVTAYTAAQFTAMGKAFGAFLGTSYAGGVWIGAAIIFFYTAIGGFKAVAYSDLLQGALMLLALLILPFLGFAAAGGWTATLAAVGAQDAALLRPLGAAGATAAGFASAAGFVAVGLAFIGAPQLLVRWISARDRREVERGGLIAVLCIIVFDLGAVFGGIAGRALFPGLADQETILPTLVAALLPAVFVGIFLVVVLAASMSTVDSLLILASSSVARDVVQQILRPRFRERRVAGIGKAATVVIGLAALLLALGEIRLIFWFVLFAWSGLACAFAPTVILSLFWRGTTRAGALAGMAAGFLTAVTWVLLLKERFLGLYEMIPGFAAGLVVTAAVSLWTAPTRRRTAA